jgi:uncharacterized protein (TIGR03067 family)
MLISKHDIAVAAVAMMGAGIGIVAYQAKAAEQEVPGPDNVAQTAEIDQKSLQGMWILTRLDQVNHEPTEEDEKFLKSGGFKVKISGTHIVFLQDGSKASFMLDPTTRPKRMDLLMISAGKKTTALAIYSLDGDKLRICMGRAGDQAPPADFDVKKATLGTFPTCLNLEREKDENQKQELEKE